MGRPSSGKTTLAEGLYKRLSLSRPTILLDGDNTRTWLTPDCSFSTEDRLRNIIRSYEVAALIRDAGAYAVCAYVTPLVHMQEFLAPRVDSLIYIDIPLDECKKRDAKGLYRRQVPDIEKFDLPVPADIQLDGLLSEEDLVESLMRNLIPVL